MKETRAKAQAAAVAAAGDRRRQAAGAGPCVARGGRQYWLYWREACGGQAAPLYCAQASWAMRLESYNRQLNQWKVFEPATVDITSDVKKKKSHLIQKTLQASFIRLMSLYFYLPISLTPPPPPRTNLFFLR